MKVVIVTQPLLCNYGGILQNYALQKVLKSLGHEPITFDQVSSLVPFSIKVKRFIKVSVCRCFFFKYKKRYINKSDNLNSNAITPFISEFINATSKSKSIHDLKKLDKQMRPDAYIVGSDQVWRPKYNNFIEASFLSFTQNRRKIAYAASFGTDKCEYNKKQVSVCRELIKQFSAISVRESSAISLCKDLFDIDAKLVLDPTMLLDKEEYRKLVDTKNNKFGQPSKFLYSYILDEEEWKTNFIKVISDELCLPVFKCEDGGKRPQEAISITEWISCFEHADFVICDSFHGVVFSIIFNKMFYVLTNESRGNARIKSILAMFGLESRLKDINSLDFNLNKDLINWGKVNDCLVEQKKQSIKFLVDNLK